ncbi:DUF4012 domain-containing protein [Candidatus Falkowbacteria bacterium]|nr:DUF4012 domain-containing protein [Candidatus Falkowbacteria bacterium]
MFRLSGSDNLNLAKIFRSARSVAQNFPLVKKVRRRRHIFAALKIISLLALVTILLLIILFAAHFLAFKSILASSLSGKSSLEQAVGMAKQGDFKSAQAAANQAASDFYYATSNLEDIKTSLVFNQVGALQYQVGQLGYLVGSAEMLSRAVGQAVSFGLELQNLLDGNRQLNYSTFSPDEKKKILGRIQYSGPELTGMKANLDLALLNLANITYPGVLWPLKGKIDETKNLVGEASQVLGKLAPMSQIIPALAGYPSTSTYLVLFQNSDELRPTGGFLGTYGILQMESGDISRFETHDIYHMDMPVKDKVDVIPPEPIRKYLNAKWYMRDANWSPDWPTAAQKIEWFYNLENPLLPPKDQVNNFSGQFDGVIAITPKLVTDLLAIVGPIVIDGQEYNPTNFVDLLEYRVEKGYVQLGVSSWQRKEVIGQIMKEMKIRLMNLPSDKWRTILMVFDNNVASKDILVYLHDQVLQGLAKEQGWTGEIKQPQSDYLMIVDANLASLKTDAVMNRSVSYEVKEGTDRLTSRLIINYAHRGKPDWKTSYYQTYTRVYVPKGSRLIKMEGCNSKPDIIDEYNKTAFGCQLIVPFNQVAPLVLEYDLPNHLKTALAKNGYGLFVQKQPGNQVSELAVDLSFINGIKSYSPVGFSVNFLTGNRIGWLTDLTLDRQYSVSF